MFFASLRPLGWKFAKRCLVIRCNFLYLSIINSTLACGSHFVTDRWMSFNVSFLHLIKVLETNKIPDPSDVISDPEPSSWRTPHRKYPWQTAPYWPPCSATTTAHTCCSHPGTENIMPRALYSSELYSLVYFKSCSQIPWSIQNIAACDYQESVTTRQTDIWMDGQTDAGQSDPYELLRFAGDTKLDSSPSHSYPTSVTQQTINPYQISS